VQDNLMKLQKDKSDQDNSNQVAEIQYVPVAMQSLA
jgi:hypothetical protein